MTTSNIMKNTQSSFIVRFLKTESASGILLMLAAVLAMVSANSFLDSIYNLFLNMPLQIKMGGLNIDKPLLLWINDGLMTVFFFLVGLELKREFLEGELSDRRNIVLPGIGAIGGMVTILNFRNFVSHSLYMLVGLILWVALLKSGVHATLAGVLLAFFIPMRSRKDPDVSPLKVLEQDLHSVVAFIILPLFAFANAGINLDGITGNQLLHGVPIGVALGLFLGKQIGIFALCWLSVKLKLSKLPTGISWSGLYGASALCGIGFTMSLFIGSLAFGDNQLAHGSDARLGIIIGSLLSGLLGYLVLRFSLENENEKPPQINKKVDLAA